MGRHADDTERISGERIGSWLPSPGTVVTISGGQLPGTWTSRVEYREGTAVVVVAPTQTRGEPVDAPPGTPIVIGWASEQGYLEADGVLTDTAVDVVLTWEVDASHVRRRQRRAAFRLPVALPIAVVAGLGDQGRRAAPVLEGETRDVSEVGVRVLLPRRDAPAVGDHVEITVRMPDQEPLESVAEVVWSRKYDVEANEVGLMFVDDNEHRAERLRRFVFAEQLERRAFRARRTRDQRWRD